jgi:hypothetical protein
MESSAFRSTDDTCVDSAVGRLAAMSFANTMRGRQFRVRRSIIAHVLRLPGLTPDSHSPRSTAPARHRDEAARASARRRCTGHIDDPSVCETL